MLLFPALCLQPLWGWEGAMCLCVPSWRGRKGPCLAVSPPRGPSLSVSPPRLGGCVSPSPLGPGRGCVCPLCWGC